MHWEGVRGGPGGTGNETIKELGMRLVGDWE